MELRSEDTRSGAGYCHIGILPGRLTLRTEDAVALQRARRIVRTVT